MSRNFILLCEQAYEITKVQSVFKLMYGLSVYETISQELWRVVIIRTHRQTIHKLAYCIFSTLHLVHLWVSDVEHLTGAISVS